MARRLLGWWVPRRYQRDLLTALPRYRRLLLRFGVPFAMGFLMTVAIGAVVIAMNRPAAPLAPLVKFVLQTAVFVGLLTAALAFIINLVPPYVRFTPEYVAIDNMSGSRVFRYSQIRTSTIKEVPIRAGTVRMLELALENGRLVTVEIPPSISDAQIIQVLSGKVLFTGAA